ncbi:MAG: histidinol-phosphate transaminase [Candidatus Eremiobacteraeota bacterium]|nr:histidinol-phosphate transaminase [Candidatus Eremiobacteraeota bacterium]
MQPSPDRLLRDALRTFTPYKPGTSVDEVRRRFGIEHPVKLSQNENPHGTSPLALAALRELDSLSAYVEDDHLRLRERLVAPYALKIENVILGHGSNELLAQCFLAFVDPGDDVVMGAPTFSLFRKNAQVAGANAVEVPLADGVHDLGAMLSAVTRRTKLVFVCDPNNPTGTRVERGALFEFARALPPGVLLVLDQAYREYMDAGAVDGVDVLRERPATLVLRTASKVYGLAAIRFGYAYSSPQIVGWLDAVRLPFNVARPAAVAVLAALDDDAFVTASVRSNDRGREQLMTRFAELGLHAYPSAANFVAVQVPVTADEAYGELLQRGIIVRSGGGLGMPDRLRVTIGTAAENAAFLAELEALLPVWRGSRDRVLL